MLIDVHLSVYFLILLVALAITAVANADLRVGARQCLTAAGAAMSEESKALVRSLTDTVDADRIKALDRCAVSVCRDVSSQSSTLQSKNFSRPQINYEDLLARIKSAAATNRESLSEIHSESMRILYSGLKLRPSSVQSKPALIAATYSIGDYLAFLRLNAAEKLPNRRFSKESDAVAAVKKELQARHPGADTSDINRLIRIESVARKMESKFYSSDDVVQFYAAVTPVERWRNLKAIESRVRSEVERALKFDPIATRQLFVNGELDQDPALQVLKSDSPINDHVESAVLEALLNYSRYASAIFDKGMESVMETPPPIERLLDTQSILGNQVPRTASVDLVRNHSECVGDLSRALLFSPSSQELVAARTSVEAARVAVDAQIQRVYGDDSKPLRQKLSKVEVLYPPSSTAMATTIASVFKLDTSSARHNLNVLRGRKISPEMALAESYGVSVLNPELAARYFSPCDRYTEAFGVMFRQTSESLNGSAAIRLSARDVSDPERALSVALHEFGHASDPMLLSSRFNVSNELSLSDPSAVKRRSINSCLALLHGASRPAAINGQFEDYADLIAGGALINLACEWYGMGNQGKLEYSTQDHSPDVFRLLHSSYLANGALKPECEAFVKKYTTWKFRNCANPN